MDCEIRDFSRENSRGFRNPWLLPGESSWHGDFARTPISAQAGAVSLHWRRHFEAPTRRMTN